MDDTTQRDIPGRSETTRRADIPRRSDSVAPEDDFPTRIADMLEQFATKARALTTDRVAGYVLWAALGLVLGLLGLLIVIFLLVALFRLIDSGLGDLLGSDVWGNVLAYVVFGGLFLGGGAFLWSKRHPTTEEA
jgi:hypothetical protein